MIFNKKEAVEHLAKGRELQRKAKQRITDNARILVLMEAGLESRPLDRDFVEKVRMIFDQELKEFEHRCEMITVLEEAVNHIAKMGEDE